MKPDAALIIVAAGNGERLGGQVTKAMHLLAGQPLLAHAISNGLRSEVVSALVVVAPAESLPEIEAVAEMAVKRHLSTAGASEEPLWMDVVAGGDDRAASVAKGLASLHARGRTEPIVLVHDAARPLAPYWLFARVAAAVRSGAPAVVPGLPVIDTIKQVDDDGAVAATLERDSLRAIQTPQGFSAAALKRAHDGQDSAQVTDDAMLIERSGAPVVVVPGDPLALKITYRVDLTIAEALLADRKGT